MARRYRMQKPANVSDRFYELMSMCWEQQPAARCTFSEIREELEAMLLEPSKHIDDGAEDYEYDCTSALAVQPNHRTPSSPQNKQTNKQTNTQTNTNKSQSRFSTNPLICRIVFSTHRLTIRNDADIFPCHWTIQPSTSPLPWMRLPAKKQL